MAVDVKFYNNGGNSLDLSASVMDRALMHSQNCYSAPHFRVRGYVCRTHQSSNTAFRGFGGPQARINLKSAVHNICTRMQLCVLPHAGRCAVPLAHTLTSEPCVLRSELP